MQWDRSRLSVIARQGSLTKRYPQVGIIGQTLQFDSPATRKITMKWSIIGCGEHSLNGTVSLDGYALPNIPVDVYLNKWVHIGLSLSFSGSYSTEYQPFGPSLFV